MRIVFGPDPDAIGRKQDQMAEIVGLAASMAALIVEKQVEGTPIPPKLFRHLVRAAQILLDNGVPWPPSVELVLAEIGRHATDAGGTDEELTENLPMGRRFTS